MKVAQKRYFNKFDKFDKTELDFLKHMSSNIKGPIKETINDLVNDISIFNELKKLQEEIANETPETLNELEKNGFELLHTTIEGHGRNLISCRKLTDLYFFNDAESKFEALMYLSFQYFRTKKQKDSQIENFKDTQLNIEKIYNVLAIISAIRIAQNISFDPNIHYNLLEISNNEISFITCDQPVINLIGDELDDEGGAKDLIFYYPISPKYAIMIDFKPEGEKFQHKNLKTEDVEKLNLKIVNEYHEFLFSDTDEQLKNYTQHRV